MSDASEWAVQTASGVWGGVNDFFNPPSTEGLPSIMIEPSLPEGTLKMYLGYPAKKTDLDSGFTNEREIDKDDPHFGLTIGKFYVDGFTRVVSPDGEHFVFLKTVGNNVELRFELAQDIDMIGKDTFITISRDNGGYDTQFGVPPTDFGRGTLLVRFTDYQNNTRETQIYTDYLAAKATGSANTVVSLNEEGDYEIALDYEIKKDYYLFGVSLVSTTYTNYRIHFSFSVRNGNCMIFPFDLLTGDELQNTSITENGFYLDLARSRFLDIDVQRSVIVEGPTGFVEDVRFNRPAKDGDEYTADGIYTISVKNRYTGESTTKTIFVGTDELLQEYIQNGFSMNRLN